MTLMSAILGGLALGLFMAISVGPTLFAIIKYSLNHSYKTGLAFVLGVSISDIMYVTMANLAAPWLDFIYKYEKQVALIGGIILAFVGLIGLVKKYKSNLRRKYDLANFKKSIIFVFELLCIFTTVVVYIYNKYIPYSRKLQVKKIEF